MNLRKYFLLRREYQRAERRWDERFDASIRWLLIGGGAKSEEVSKLQIFSSIPKAAEEQQELDPAATFAAVSAALGAV